MTGDEQSLGDIHYEPFKCGHEGCDEQFLTENQRWIHMKNCKHGSD